MDFLIKRDDLSECRVAQLEPEPLESGCALLRVDAFGMTTNNITYAVFGDAMSYWDFFRADDGWGRVPVWGFAEVEDAGDSGLTQGARIFGYLPPSSRAVVTPQHIDDRRFIDAAPHRANLPAAYNSYTFADAMPLYEPRREAEQMLLWPLFFTSFLLDDFLGSENLFRATTVIVSSASSKTALGTAFQLRRREGVELVGLTSEERVSYVEGLDAYDRVVAYPDTESLPTGPAIYVDISGDGGVRASVHERYGDELRHSAIVGATHFDRLVQAEAGSLPGPRPTFFFAPDQIRRRAPEWGRGGLDSRFAGAWEPFVDWAAGWLQIVRGQGGDAVRSAYLDLLNGRTDPSVGYALTP